MYWAITSVQPCDSTGIFKIEDSAHVARLWGLRKNRPAMNYDKLSRSIRQYYKKGIIRKPDVSQRLVYQFVHPVWGRGMVAEGRWRHSSPKAHNVTTTMVEHLSPRWNCCGEHVHLPSQKVHTSTANTVAPAAQEHQTKHIELFPSPESDIITQQKKVERKTNELPCHLHHLPVFLFTMWSLVSIMKHTELIALTDK